MKRWLTGALLALGLAGPTTLAHADEIPCTVWVVEGSAAQGGVDPRLVRLRRYLEKPMFGEFHKFALVEEKHITLGKDGTDTFDLPNGRQGTLTLLGEEQTPKKKRLRLKLTIVEPTNKHLDTTFVIDNGGIVLHAGEKHSTGKLILGVSCGTK